MPRQARALLLILVIMQTLLLTITARPPLTPVARANADAPRHHG